MQFKKISAALAQTTPGEISYEEEKDFQIMNYSGSGSATAAITAKQMKVAPRQKFQIS
jgi:hypothetical protein